MARARNIKPGFFRDADLVELTIETRLLFIGLWTIADREGRLEDRPKQIKMELFPADSFGVDSMLQQLNDSGFIERYTANGNKYIQVTNFTKHQNPHRDEKASTIPAPCKHHANTVAIGLIPDSLNLIPEVKALSGNPDDTPETPKPKKSTFTKEAQEVLSYLNGVVGSRFEPVPANIGLITARLKDGATVESMKAVIDRKHREWATDGEMSKYLRPATLFNATKFAQYAGESGPARSENSAIQALIEKHGSLKRLPNGSYLAPNGQRYNAEGRGGSCI